MHDKLKKAFDHLKNEQIASQNEVIWRAIITENQRIARIKLWIFSVAMLVFVSVLIPVFGVLSKNLSQSGFYQYFSLIFSDLGILISHWREFGLLLAESLPTMTVITFMLAIFIFFLLLKYIFRQIIIRNQLAF